MLARRSRLLLVLSLVLVAGFLVTSLASFFASRASLRRQIDESALPLTSDNIYSEIQRDLLRPIFISSLMAHDTFVRDWVLEDEHDPERITRYLKTLQTKYETITAFFVSERTRTYYHADGILKKVSPDAWRDAWYFRVREMETPYEINVDPDMANRDAMTIFVNYRMLDYDGNFIGATGVGLTVSAIKSLIETYEERYERRIYFVDKAGDIVLHGSRFPAGIDTIADIPGMGDAAQRLPADTAGTFTYKRDGETVHVNTRFIDDFDWLLIVEQPEDHTLARIWKTLLINLGICAGVVLVVLLLTHVTLGSYHRTIERMAATDKLTGAHNRRAFDLLFHEAKLDADRNGTPLSVVMLDIDRFKQVNDTHGHLAGDRVLQELTTTLNGCIRAMDVVCRWGGEEFIILLERCAIDEAEGIAEKLRKAVEDMTVRVKGEAIEVTVSLGVAQYRKGDDEDALIGRVDRALYAAKAAGRNCTRRAEPAA